MYEFSQEFCDCNLFVCFLKYFLKICLLLSCEMFVNMLSKRNDRFFLIIMLFFVSRKDCSIGFYGYPQHCLKCPFPSYGNDCQSICSCSNESCNHVTGCSSLMLETGIFAYLLLWLLMHILIVKFVNVKWDFCIWFSFYLCRKRC